MLRLSRLADYAVVVLIRLSEDDSVQTTPGIALATGIPEPTVAKVLKALAGHGLVLSQRGSRGGGIVFHGRWELFRSPTLLRSSMARSLLRPASRARTEAARRPECVQSEAAGIL